MPISRTTLLVVSVAGTRCEASVDSPMAAITDETASSTGTPAAISAPNATMRIASVTGRLRISARWKSSPRVSSSALLIDWPPTCSTRRSGWAACTAAVASSSGPTRSLAVSASPDIVTGTSSAVPSCDGTGSPTLATSGSAPSRRAASAAAARAAVSSSAPSRAVMSTLSTGGYVKSPADAIASARPASPIRWSASDASLSPAEVPPTKQTATNTIHSAMARHGCSALHRATRTVIGRLTIPAPP